MHNSSILKEVSLVQLASKVCNHEKEDQREHLTLTLAWLIQKEFPFVKHYNHLSEAQIVIGTK